MKSQRFIVLMLATTIFLQAMATTHAIIRVPPGNRNAIQPEIPYGSIKRNRGGERTFQKKYARTLKLLDGNRKLLRKIKKSAAAYRIDPVHIVGALVGEHTYNVDAMDRYQTYYVKALAYLNQDLSGEDWN